MADNPDADVKSMVLVTGSTAIDQTGFYAGSFADYESKYSINALNLSFQLAGMETSFGGCAPNIAYGLNLLDVDVLPLSSAGRNFRDRYLGHLQSEGINTSYIAIDDANENCASCMMINDSEGNQIISFYPGPGTPLRKLPSQIPEVNQVALAILGPEAADLTLRQARDLATLGIPIMFDPGQVIAEFSETELRELIELSDYLVVNQHEYGVLQANVKLGAEEIERLVPEVIVTRGKAGVDIYCHASCHHVDAIRDIDIVDVTGCGDAFRAGYAYGILDNLDPAERGQIGCLMAMRNLKSSQTQNYRITSAEVLALRQQHYG